MTVLVLVSLFMNSGAFTLSEIWNTILASISQLTSCVGSDHLAGPASVAQLDAPSDWRLGGRGFDPRRGQQHSFVEIDHEIFSTVILSLLLIQEG